jgi:hypothetical protein
MKKLSVVLLAVLFIAACKKDKNEPDPVPVPTPAATTGSITFQFDPVVADSPLVFTTKYYKNFNNDSFKVVTFRYYVSNIVLTKSDNSTYTVPNSYYKINHNVSGANKFTMSSIPIGNYKSIDFMIGVDSTHNVSGAQDGDLSISDMYWSWTTGYIFAKFEGSSPKSTAPQQTLTYHIGGFKVPNSSIRDTTIIFGSSTANIAEGTTPVVRIKSDLAKWFYGGGGTIDFALTNSVMSPGANAKKLADNYKQSFSFISVTN